MSSIFSYNATVDLGVEGPELSFSGSVAVGAYSKIEATLPACVSLNEVVPEYNDWIVPESGMDDLVEDYSEWEDVPLLLNEFDDNLTVINVQPSELENISAFVLKSSNYEDIYYSPDEDVSMYELSAPVLLIGAGNVGFLGNAARKFNFYNYGPSSADITMLVMRNAIK